MKTSGFREIDFDDTPSTLRVINQKPEIETSLLPSMLSDVLMGLFVIVTFVGLAFLIYKFYPVFIVLVFFGFCGAIGGNL